MGKSRLPSAAKAKGRWRKGDACVSNPKIRKHREQARNSLILPYQNASQFAKKGLTVAALSKHDDTDLDAEISSEKTVSQSFASSAPISISGLTDCSNLTFEKVHKLWASPLEQHKQICAVLAAVTEVIRTKGGNETETEYFGTLIVALQAATDDETLSAIIFLLYLVMKRLPQAVLRHKFSETSKLLSDILAKYSNSDTSALVKNLLCCLSTLLLNQEAGVWQSTSTQHLFQSILSFTISTKPKVRKTAHVEVGTLMKLNLANKSIHLIASSTNRFCLHYLQRPDAESQTSTLHILNFLKIVLQYLPTENLKAASEAIMNLMRSCNTITKLNCLQTLDGLFASHPSESNLPATLNGRIITAMYDFQPSLNDVNMAAAWLKVMQSAYINLSMINGEKCIASLPHIFSSVMTFILSDSRQIVLSAFETAKGLVEQSLLPLVDLLEAAKNNQEISSFRKIFRQIEIGLKYKYQPSWDVVLDLLSIFFKNFGRIFHKDMIKCLVTLCDLHNNEDFPHLAELKKAVAAAFKSMGPRVVLDAVPLNLKRTDNNCNFPRAWMLPLLKDNIESAELQYFVDHFLPILAHLREKEISSVQNGQILEAKVFETLQQQVWLLLPGFFNKPVDLKDSFKNIARILGKALMDEPKVRLVILQSLRAALSNGISCDEDDKELQKYSKNYLPILFNLYLSESENGNDKTALPVLETMKAYIKITDQTLVTTFIQNAFTKLVEDGCPQKKKHALMDLIIAMVTYSSESCMEKVYNATIPLLQSVERTEQKKAYRIIEEICHGRSDTCRNFVTSKLEDLKEKLFTSMSAAAPSSKAPRLRCLTGIVRQLDTKNIDFLKFILPEVILYTKANNVKAKVSAFSLLEEIGNAFIYADNRAKEDSVASYIEMVMAGLATSSHMISATLLSLGKICSVYRDFLPPNVVKKLLLSSVQLLRSKDREVMKSALAFAKVLISLLDREELSGHTETMVKNLFSGKRGDKNVLRTQTKFILEKLMRKVGYEIVHSVTPSEHRKFVSAIYKNYEKKKQASKKVLNTKENAGKGEDDEMSDMSEDDNAKKMHPIKKNQGSWIVEEGDDVVDLLDTRVATKITGTEPISKGKSKEETTEFMFEEGKLVIKDIGERSLLDKGPSNDNSALGEASKSLKRKRISPDDINEEAVAKYQPGGTGIHRPASKRDQSSNSTKAREALGQEYRAKKAGGDIKLKGKPDPFAYIPLDRGNLNRRKRAKISGKFKGIVKATKRNARIKPQRKRNKKTGL